MTESTNGKCKKFQIIKGGAGVMEAILKAGVCTIDSASLAETKKSEWDEIRDILCPAASKHKITPKRSEEILKQARAILNDSSC